MPVGQAPSVGVVIATHNRPELMRQALDSVLGQHHDGPIRVVLVFDRCEPEPDLARADPHRTITVLTNQRTPGLAGARNTGILALDTELIGFCDDDDVWLEGKLAAQVDRMAESPAAGFTTTAMRVRYGDRSTVRQTGQRQVSVRDLARSRMSMLHSSSFLFRRTAMLGAHGFGLVDETIQRSMGEDWDLLLRAARQYPIEQVDEPLISVLWGQTSYFNDAWLDKNAAHQWLIEHHPEIRDDPRALGLMLGKLAFGHAAVSERGEALRLARRAARVNWREPRTVLAVLVVLGVSPGWVTKQLNKRGHGI